MTTNTVHRTAKPTDPECTKTFFMMSHRSLSTLFYKDAFALEPRARARDYQYLGYLVARVTLFIHKSDNDEEQSACTGGIEKEVPVGLVRNTMTGFDPAADAPYAYPS